MEIINGPTEVVGVDQIQPHPRNARQGDVGAIHESIASNGFYGAVVAQRSTGYILAGNHRWMAACAAGASEIPVTWVDVDDDRALRILLADNRTNDIASYDDNALADLLTELAQTPLGLDGTGFDGDALDELLADLGREDTTPSADPAPQIDRAAELQEVWGTERGQIWAIPSKTVPGKSHRLMCGDSTSAEDVARLMGGEKVGVCFTSPPYMQQREYGDVASEMVKDWDGLMQGVFANLPVGLDGQVLVNLGLVHHDGEWVPYWDTWVAWMRKQGWRRFGWYVWDQMSGFPGIFGGRCAPSHEFVFHFNKRSTTARKHVRTKNEGTTSKTGSMGAQGWQEDGRGVRITGDSKIPDSVWRISRTPDGSVAHPAKYPVELPAQALRTWEGDVYDPFLGSGTTMVAAENEHRVCYGMEIDPGYVAVILQRMTDMGLSPHRVTRDEDDG